MHAPSHLDHPAPPTSPRAGRAPAARPLTEKSGFTILVVHNTEGLAAHVPAWQALAEHAVECNVFFEPWFLLPALEAVGAGERFSFVLLFKRNPASGQAPLLHGFFPLRCSRLSRLAPLGVLESWKHPYSYLATPLIREDDAEGCLHAFFDWLQSDPLGAALWRLEEVNAEGPFAWLLHHVCQQRRRPVFLVDAWCRRLFVPGTDTDSSLHQAMTHKHVKDIRRKERTLAQRGRLERRILEPAGDVSQWIDDFLKLESSGWKGRSGTALACRPADAAFFRRVVEAGFAQGRMFLIGLYLDERPIAMKCHLLAGKAAFAFKIAFDESVAAHSPGVLLEVAAMDVLHENRFLEWIDSCAARESMFDRLWLGRRALQTLFVATGRAPGDLVVSLMPLARWVRAWLHPCRPRTPCPQEHQ
jgi:hypothetical protein